MRPPLFFRVLFGRGYIEPTKKGRNRMWLFTKDAAIGIVRTVMPFVWTWAATNIPAVVSFAEGTLNLTLEGFVLIVGGVFYTAVRAVAEKFPKVGYLLVFNQAPTY